MLIKAALALVSGACLTFSFAPYQYAWIAYACLAILFAIWHDQSARQAFICGWLFGFGLFISGTYWIYISTHQFAYVAAPIAILLCVFLSIGMGLYPAIAGYLSCRWSVPGRWQLSLVFPLVWVLCEWWRGWFLSGFPWFNIGYSQVDTVLSGWAPVLGVYGVSLMLALTVGWLLAIYYYRIKWLVVGIVVLWSSAWLLQQQHWTEVSSDPVRVSLLQANIPQDKKWLPEVYTPTLETYLGLTQSVWDSSDLIIWPESAIPGFYHEVEADILARLSQVARLKQTDIMLGILVKDDQGDYYNALLAITKEAPQFYYKRHLVPFSEYLPSLRIFQWILDILKMPVSGFSAGEGDQPLLSAAGLQVGASICYEGGFPNDIKAALPNADILVNISNEAWFSDSIALAQNLQMARMRALETGRYLLRATNTGMTAVINPQGQLQSQLSPQTLDILQDSVYAMAGLTPYGMMGNWPVVLICCSFLLLYYLIFFKAR